MPKKKKKNTKIRWRHSRWQAPQLPVLGYMAQAESLSWCILASELYRPWDRLLSAKLVPTFADREVSRSQRDGSPSAVILISFRPEPLLSLPSSS
jgi:hypothetical protein